MKVRYIYHSSFLVETDRFYYLFDYANGSLPAMDTEKPIFVLASHSHADHYNPAVFSLLSAAGMRHICAILSEDIGLPSNTDALQVSPGREYELGFQQRLTIFQSTDMGVAFLIEDQETLIYHAGDLNDWVWEGESSSYNEQMTVDYRRQIDLLAQKLGDREIDAAFVVLDPRQEKDYDRGLCYFIENISSKQLYPMHYWEKPEIIDTFLNEHPEYQSRIQRTESNMPPCEQKRGRI